MFIHAPVRSFGMRTAPLAGILALLVFLGVSVAPAQEIPPRINYQGQLTNENGDPIDNASVTMQFSLYDAATGGTKQWPAGTENHTVNVSDGLFNVILGSIEYVLNAELLDRLPDVSLHMRGQVIEVDTRHEIPFGASHRSGVGEQGTSDGVDFVDADMTTDHQVLQLGWLVHGLSSLEKVGSIETLQQGEERAGTLA